LERIEPIRVIYFQLISHESSNYYGMRCYPFFTNFGRRLLPLIKRVADIAAAAQDLATCRVVRMALPSLMAQAGLTYAV
jgi:hypothetical protein